MLAISNGQKVVEAGDEIFDIFCGPKYKQDDFTYLSAHIYRYGKAPVK